MIFHDVNLLSVFKKNQIIKCQNFHNRETAKQDNIATIFNPWKQEEEGVVFANVSPCDCWESNTHVRWR